MAGALYTYRIVFDESGGENNETPVQPENGEEIDTQNPTKSKKTNTSNVKTALNTAMLMQLGKSAINFATSEVGFWTGSSVAQDKVNFAMKGLGYIGAFATNWKMALVALAVDIGTTGYQQSKEAILSNRQSQENARHLGVINRRSR